MRKQASLFLGLSIIMIAAGLLLIKNGAIESLLIPYLLVGLGAGLFGHSVSELVNQQVEKNNPDFAKMEKINREDERNQLIRAKAKEKAYNLTTYLLAALMLTFALMKESMAIVLSLVAVYLFIQFYAIYWRFRLEKEL
ncbi:hypothetical protein [Enterococcus sp. AZ109]|uniref:hypothetical protein n=1 Tax=Enterococcus sp. AZ109 TaxID=2774634 RepID=UPI003F29C3C2